MSEIESVETTTPALDPEAPQMAKRDVWTGAFREPAYRWLPSRNLVEEMEQMDPLLHKGVLTSEVKKEREYKEYDPEGYGYQPNTPGKMKPTEPFPTNEYATALTSKGVIPQTAGTSNMPAVVLAVLAGLSVGYGVTTTMLCLRRTSSANKELPLLDAN